MANRSAASLNAPRLDDAVVAEAVRLLAETCRPERIYLFGSVPRGEATADSDYDFMVVVPDDAPPELKDDRRAFRALASLAAPMDVLVWTRSEFDRRLHLRASLPSTVVREGILLYGS